MCIGRQKVVSDRRGTSAVEFALITPVMIFILAAIFGYGLMFMTSISLHQLGADAARSTIGGLSLDEKRALAASHLQNVASDYVMLEPDSISFEVLYSTETQTTVLEVLYEPVNHPIRVFEGILPMPENRFRVRQSIRENR